MTWLVAALDTTHMEALLAPAPGHWQLALAKVVVKADGMLIRGPGSALFKPPVACER